MLIKLQTVIQLLKEFTHQEKKQLEIILLGGLALDYYGMKDRTTVDIDGEVKGDLLKLLAFLKLRGIPADLGEDISRWSTISMPEGYRQRATELYKDSLLVVKVLNPLDLIIAKLRRFTDEDIEDAFFIAKKFEVTSEAIEQAKENAILHSPQDSMLLNFNKNVEFLLRKLREEQK